jgi:gamma-glutamyl:cysteine ligase YbdK (ATP-grasp superfamily)
MPCLKDTIAVATLVQALCIKIGQDWEEGKLDNPTPNWLIENNKWAAIKNGLNAEFIIDTSGTTKPITSVIHDLVTTLSPISAEFGSIDNLQSVKFMLEKDQTVNKMREISNQGTLIEVVHFLEEQLISSL